MLDLWNNGPSFKSAQGLGLCSKGSFIHFSHFSLLAAWLDMTYDVERAIKPNSRIHPIAFDKNMLQWMRHIPKIQDEFKAGCSWQVICSTDSRGLEGGWEQCQVIPAAGVRWTQETQITTHSVNPQSPVTTPQILDKIPREMGRHPFVLLADWWSINVWSNLKVVEYKEQEFGTMWKMVMLIWTIEKML